MSTLPADITGLNPEQVVAARKAYGRNSIELKKKSNLVLAVLGLIKEPMVILLLLAAGIYFLTGKIGDGIFLSVAILLVATISWFQDRKTRIALAQLKSYNQPICKVYRDGQLLEIPSEDLVVGDSMLVEEGMLVAADGALIYAHDLSINESILTGESVPVAKEHISSSTLIYQGTTVVTGLGIATVTAIGIGTELGKIGKSLNEIEEEQSPLEKQINDFVKKMVIIGVIVFGIVWILNFLRGNNALVSLQMALTLAMSILPEEIPVAFTTFMALGAWRLMKMGIVVKQMKTVETLGSATVICLDKTGTITENNMRLAKLYVPSEDRIVDATSELTEEEISLIKTAMWASEPIPFDPMEKSLHAAYARVSEIDNRPSFQLIHEYPLSGKPPMMTHVFEDKNGNRIIAAKGAPEAFLNGIAAKPDEVAKTMEALKQLAADGYRVLGVASAMFEGEDFPEMQEHLDFNFKGIVAFYDPPKANIKAVFEAFYNAGMKIKIITGDNAITTAAIAQQTGFKGFESAIQGDEFMKLTDDERAASVSQANLFTRTFPEAKLHIIRALKANSEIVAMTGDGVNDGPALKEAHIGIAMGKKGSEIARQAAALILLEDDLSAMVAAIGAGRRIYANLKKAIRYIISIHIPIILTVFLPLVLGWIYPNIFSPVHIIFLELIMGPTCSIIYENEPMEADTMTQKPRPFSASFFNLNELGASILQGLVITLGTLAVYQYAVRQGFDESLARTMVFTTLIVANIFLTLVNRSFYYSIFTTLKYKNNLVALIISATILIAGLMLYVTPIQHFFGLAFMGLKNVSICLGAGFASVIWYELVKLLKRNAGRTGS